MKRIHFMGIGGVGMAGVAFLLKKAGHAVTGCDKYASPRTRWLESCGIPVSVGHDPAHVAPDLDELIVTPAVPPSAPECAAAAARRVRVRRRGEVLAELFNAAEGIAVCGTHGKTTTSTFLAKLLRALGENVSWAIGGETGDFPVAGVGTGPQNLGTGPEKSAKTSGIGVENRPFVVEADESDGTLALYHARTLVVMNMDYDHPEHFKTEAAYRACYQTAMDNAQDVVKAWELDASDFPELPALVAGAHNVVNARAAIEVALRRGHSRDAIRSVLPAVLAALPDRRFQTIHASSLTIVTDYAHHPREIACALEMARARRPKRLRVLFQPHRYSRTAALLHDFPPALAAADELVLIPVYAAFEEPHPGGDIADLYRACRNVTGTGPQRLFLARSALEAWRHVYLTRAPGDLVVLLGAGDLISLVPRILSDMAPHDETPGPVIPLGAGTNTWRTDLATDARYVRTSGPASATGATLGIPWMAGIPGTIGGWIKMNAGAFGHSISEVLDTVTVELPDGARRTLSASACGFGYRTSSIPGVIVDFTLKNPLPLGADVLSAEAYRARRLPFPPGTKGSVFKNPPNDHAGRLLEEAGAKNLHVGGAYVWERHANVIVAGPDATASDVLALARLMAAAVFHRFGIRLEPEVRGIDVN